MIKVFTKESFKGYSLENGEIVGYSNDKSFVVVVGEKSILEYEDYLFWRVDQDELAAILHYEQNYYYMQSLLEDGLGVEDKFKNPEEIIDKYVYDYHPLVEGMMGLEFEFASTGNILLIVFNKKQINDKYTSGKIAITMMKLESGEEVGYVLPRLNDKKKNNMKEVK